MHSTATSIHWNRRVCAGWQHGDFDWFEEKYFPWTYSSHFDVFFSNQINYIQSIFSDSSSGALLEAHFVCRILKKGNHFIGCDLQTKFWSEMGFLSGPVSTIRLSKHFQSAPISIRPIDGISTNTNRFLPQNYFIWLRMKWIFVENLCARVCLLCVCVVITFRFMCVHIGMTGDGPIETCIITHNINIVAGAAAAAAAAFVAADVVVVIRCSPCKLRKTWESRARECSFSIRIYHINFVRTNESA